MRIGVRLAQVLAVLLERACLVPPLRYARVVLPRVKQLDVRRVGGVERHHAEGLAQVRDVPAVDDGPGAGLGAPARVPGEGG